MAVITKPGFAGYGIRRRGSFAGKALDLGIVVDVWINPPGPVFDGPQKPGIPTGTEEWLKTTLEILTGRRGNKIDVPEIPEITFSSTPTQAQCEQLYASLKATRDALNEFKKRLDS